MRRSRFTPVVLIGILLLLTAMTASAQRVRSVHPGSAARVAPTNGPTVDFTPCLFFLGLSDAQRLEIRQIIEAEQPAIDAITTQMRTDHEALMTLANATPADACAIGTAYLKEVADRKALEIELQTLRTKVEAVLTIDQKAKLDGCIAALTNLGPRP